ncbi:hypothetical protein IIK97_004060 [Salmonella enterica subsp. enterica serovar Nigeria]|nr:hypothetical protein [Salmonella enterica subsp. enterica serovar Nigeria]
MALNPRKKHSASDADIEKLAKTLADKPYAGSPSKSEPEEKEKMIVRSFTITRELDEHLSRLAAQNALDGTGPKNASALLRHIVAEYLAAHPIR